MAELNSQGLLRGCSSHWRLDMDGIMGLRNDATEPGDWQRECAVAATILGVEPIYHPMIGMDMYVALPLNIRGALAILAKDAILWLGRHSHHAYIGTMSCTVKRPMPHKMLGHRVQTFTLEEIDLTDVVMTELSHRYPGSMTATGYANAFREHGDKLWLHWWTGRLQAMSTISTIVQRLQPEWSDLWADRKE